MRRHGRFTRATTAALAGAFLLVADHAWADPARFLPWKEPANPALQLNDLGGRPRTLADYRGRVVLVNFWATWCEPCRDEMASMRKLQQLVSGRPFAVLLVNYGESRARVADFVRRESIDFQILLDPNQEAPRAWRVRVLPSSFLVDPGGRVRYSVIGELDWSSAAARTIVDDLWREGAGGATRPAGMRLAGSAGRPGGAASALAGSRRP